MSNVVLQITKIYLFPHTSFSVSTSVERFHPRGQHLCNFIGTKESVYIRQELNSQRIGLKHQHGRRLIVLENQYGRRDVM